MNILYISDLSSKKVNNLVFERSSNGLNFAIQKFNRLIVKGLISNDATVTLLSRPVVHNGISPKDVGAVGVEKEDGIIYHYIPCLSNTILRYFFLLIYSFVYTIKWCICTKGKKVIICDVVKPSITLGALIGAKLIREDVCAIVTDIPGNMHQGVKVSPLIKFRERINKSFIGSFSKYILLTEAMTEKVNPHNKPYLVMEGLCDMSLLDNVALPIVEKECPPIVMYAGGVQEVYGLKMLVEAFIKANVDARLLIYGNGSYTKRIEELHELYPNVVYGGTLPNEKIVETEQRATLLVNPRFSTEEYTKYSFPSKNMEYMASGTALLTTKLPGMPKEYYDYVYLFESETIDGYAMAIRDTLNLGSKELAEKGQKAKKFVLEKKNNLIQTYRIIKFLKD